MHHAGAMLTLFARRLKGQNEVTDVDRTRRLSYYRVARRHPSIDLEFEAHR